MNDQPKATCPACGHEADKHLSYYPNARGCYADGTSLGGDRIYCPCSLTPADIALLTSPTRAEDAEIVRVVREPSDDDNDAIGKSIRYDATQGLFSATETAV